MNHLSECITADYLLEFPSVEAVDSKSKVKYLEETVARV